MAKRKTFTDNLPVFKKLLHQVGPYLAQHKGLIGLAFVSLIAQTLFRLLEPWPMKFILDAVIEPDNVFDQTLAPLANLSLHQYFALIAMVFVVIAACRAFFTYLMTVSMALVGNHVITGLRGKLFDHLQSLSTVYHQTQRSGDLVVRIISDMGVMKEVAVTAVIPLLGNLLVFIGVLAVMLWLNWSLALIAISPLPLVWLVTLRKSRSIHLVAKKNRKREGAMASTASESINAIKSVQALTLQQRFSASFQAANSKSLKEGVKGKRLAASLQRSVEILIALSTALVLSVGAMEVIKNQLTPGELLVFVYYLRRVFRPIRDVSKYTARLSKAAAASERVMEVLNQKQTIVDHPDSTVAPTLDGGIEFRDINFSYLNDQCSQLQQLNIKITARSKVAIVGPSGSGKSTLIGLLLRLHEANSGMVLIDGKDVCGYTLDSVRKQISVVLQDTTLFATSIYNNITIGCDEPVEIEAVRHAAQLAGIDEYIVSLPQGYDTEVGERGVTLSMGQRQRIAIARAALKHAPILILDEPTTGLDPATEQAVMCALNELAELSTTLLVTHRSDMLPDCDHIVFLKQGEVVAQGTHEQLCQMNDEYAMQFARERLSRKVQ